MNRRKIMTSTLACFALAAGPVAASTGAHAADADRAAGWSSNFNYNHNGWSVVSGSWYHCQGRYWCSDGRPGAWNSVRHANTYRNFVYQTTLKREGNGGGYYNNSLIVRAKVNYDGEDQFGPAYMFTFSNNNYFSVWKHYGDGSYDAIKGWTYSSAIDDLIWKKLKVVANGPRLTFSINGRQVWSGYDYSFSAGQVGVTFYSETGYWSTMRIDSASLQTLYSNAKVKDDPAAPLGKTVPGGSPMVAPH